MTNLTKFSKGMLLAASLTFASLSVSAHATPTPSVNQMNTYLITALQQAFSAQISTMADEIDREIDVAIENGLNELGFENEGNDKVNQQQRADKGEEK